MGKIKPVERVSTKKRPTGDKVEKHRIPYDQWINSQLSVARHYGGCTINGKTYKLDYDNAKKKLEKDEKGFPVVKYYPDLVEQ